MGYIWMNQTYKSREEANPLLPFAMPYDSALPEPWFDTVFRVLGIREWHGPYNGGIIGEMVWSYADDIAPIFGAPFPLSNYGANILRLFESCRKGW